MRTADLTLEKIAVGHAATLLIFATWGLGGAAPWSRFTLCVLGTAGLAVTLLAVRERMRGGKGSLRLLHWLWPVLLFDLLVFSSLFQPSFRSATVEGSAVFVPLQQVSALPSSARPEVTAEALWLANALFIPCFNLVLAVRQRRLLRLLLLVTGANALALAIFGTLQTLIHAPGLYFGTIPSPNPNFFATFIYQNHWGAFAVLMFALLVGIVFHDARKPGYRNFWHSPAFGLAIAAGLLAATAPLSRSRAATALVLVLGAAACAHALRVLNAHRRAIGRSAGGPALILALAVAVAGLGMFWLAKPIIAERAADTRAQWTAIRDAGTLGSRARLYSDTWKMAQDRFWFGWGLGSYPAVFTLYNTHESPADRLPVHFEDAHSDWLQSLAEVGVVGTGLRIAALLLPLAALRRRRPLPVLSLYLLAGCGAIVAYAGIEFPFGNPAVTFAFLLCFFCAIRLALLEERERTP